MRINHNISALNTYHQLSANNASSAKSLQKLSSGLRINQAADDAAGLAISEKMRGQIRGLDQAARNAQDGISLIQTAEGAMNETTSILQRMRELAVQSASDTNTSSDRTQLQKEVDQLATEINRIANNTEFNTKKLLNGGAAVVSGTSQGTKLESGSFKTTGTGTAARLDAGTALDATTRIFGNNWFALTVKDSLGNVLGGAEQQICIQSGTYNRSDLVAAINARISVNTDLAGKVTATLNTTTNKMSFTTTDTGALAGLTLNTPTDPRESALNAMGFRADTPTLTGTVAHTGSTDFNPLSYDDEFTITVGVASYFIDLNGQPGIGANSTLADIKAALQNRIDAQMGPNAVTVGDDGANHVTLTAQSSEALSVSEGASPSDRGQIVIFGGDMSVSAGANTFDTGAFNTEINGTSGSAASAGTDLLTNLADSGGSSLGLQTGNVITISGQKGGAAFTGNYTIAGGDTLNTLAGEIQSAIGGSAVVVFNNATQQFDITGEAGTAKAITNLKLAAKVSAVDNTAVAPFNAYMSAFTETQAAQSSSTSTPGGSSFLFQIGANANQSVSLSINAMDAATLGVSGAAAATGGSTTTTTVNGANITSALTGSPAYSAVSGEAINMTFVQGSAAGTTPSTSGSFSASKTLTSNLVTALSPASDAQVTISTDTGSTWVITAATLRARSVVDGNSLTPALTSTFWTATDVSFWYSVFPNGDWGINSNTVGSASFVKVDVTGSNAAERAAIETLFNMSGDSKTVYGTDQVVTPAVSSKVTLADNNGHSVDVNVNDSDTSFAGSGYFAGLGVTLAGGKALTDLTGNAASTVKFSTVSTPATGGSSGAGIDISTHSSANAAITTIDSAITTVSTERAKMGAVQNRLEHTVKNLGTTSENLTAAESRVRDVDMAGEMIGYTKNSILAQAATAMMAQANQAPQEVLQLLKT